MRPVCGGVRDARGTTLIEVMITIALLGVGLYFFLQALYEVSSAQREVQHRLTAAAAAEQIAEAVMAYTGSNECLYNLYHNPPDVEITDQDTDVATVSITKKFESETVPGKYMEVHLTMLRYDSN